MLPKIGRSGKWVAIVGKIWRSESKCFSCCCYQRPRPVPREDGDIDKRREIFSRRIRHSGDTNARPGALLAALASNTPRPQRKRRHQEKEKKKKGEGLATGNQKGFG